MLKTVWSFITHKKRNNQFSDRRQISEIKGYKDIFVLWGEIWTVCVKLRRCTIVRRLKKFGKIKHSFKFCWPFPKTQLLFYKKILVFLFFMSKHEIQSFYFILILYASFSRDVNSIKESSIKCSKLVIIFKSLSGLKNGNWEFQVK